MGGCLPSRETSKLANCCRLQQQATDEDVITPTICWKEVMTANVSILSSCSEVFYLMTIAMQLTIHQTII
jgi:hypothetical protein